LIIHQIEKGNTANFIQQLSMIQEMYLGFVLKIYVDNAKWHKTQSVKDFLSQNPRIKLDFLPIYAPNANPMERHWWYLRKKKMKNKVFNSKQECWEAIEDHLKTISKEEINSICQI
jgi:transposase